MHEDYFVVESENPNLEFSFEIKAKQIDFTEERLEEFKENNKEDIVGFETVIDVKNLKKGEDVVD